MVAGAEPVDAAQHDAGVDLMAGVQLGEPVGEERVAGARSLAEVRRQLDARLVHHRPPTSRPSSALASPASSATIRLRHAIAGSPSCAGRWVSSIHVEKVV